MSKDENSLDALLGHALEDVQTDGIASAGKKFLGGLLGNVMSGLTGGAHGDSEDESDESDDSEEAEETTDTSTEEDTDTGTVESPDSDDGAVINTAGGNYLDKQDAHKRDHDVDDDIDGDDDDTSDEQNG
jgi:hypothetical protein